MSDEKIDFGNLSPFSSEFRNQLEKVAMYVNALSNMHGGDRIQIQMVAGEGINIDCVPNIALDIKPIYGELIGASKFNGNNNIWAYTARLIKFVGYDSSGNLKFEPITGAENVACFNELESSNLDPTKLGIGENLTALIAKTGLTVEHKHVETTDPASSTVKMWVVLRPMFVDALGNMVYTFNRPSVLDVDCAEGVS